MNIHIPKLYTPKTYTIKSKGNIIPIRIRVVIQFFYHNPNDRSDEK
jgi:hypothetical protein